MDNIFVLCTGRCGSMTFARACEHATNYTAAHESVGLRHGLAYPDHHIEVNNRLVWYLGLLHQRYPDARYVHLRRDTAETAASYAKRSRGPCHILGAWRSAIRCGWFPRRGWDVERPVEEDAREMVDAMRALIELFLGTLSADRQVTVDIADPASFGQFWAWAGLSGGRTSAMATFRMRYN